MSDDKNGFMRCGKDGLPIVTAISREVVAAVPRELREAAKQALLYPPVKFTGVQALAVGQGFIKAIDDASYTIFASGAAKHKSV